MMKPVVLGALLFIAGIVTLGLYSREKYTDPESPVSRPEKNGVWLSKIDAEATLGGNDDDYIRVLQAFYDKVYKPAEIKPKDSDIETFLKTPDANIPGVDPGALRKIIAAGFHTERTITGAQREQGEIAFEPDASILQPKDGVDEVFVRTESIYTPADNRIGELPEGVYKPVVQQAEPRHSGEYDDRSTSWHSGQFSKF
jgi:hypothetical protein